MSERATKLRRLTSKITSCEEQFSFQANSLVREAERVSHKDVSLLLKALDSSLQNFKLLCDECQTVLSQKDRMPVATFTRFFDSLYSFVDDIYTRTDSFLGDDAFNGLLNGEDKKNIPQSSSLPGFVHSSCSCSSSSCSSSINNVGKSLSLHSLSFKRPRAVAAALLPSTSLINATSRAAANGLSLSTPSTISTQSLVPSSSSVDGAMDEEKDTSKNDTMINSSRYSASTSSQPVPLLSSALSTNSSAEGAMNLVMVNYAVEDVDSKALATTVGSILPSHSFSSSHSSPSTEAVARNTHSSVITSSSSSPLSLSENIVYRTLAVHDVSVYKDQIHNLIRCAFYGLHQSFRINQEDLSFLA